MVKLTLVMVLVLSVLLSGCKKDADTVPKHRTGITTESTEPAGPADTGNGIVLPDDNW